MLPVKVIVARTAGKVALETIELDERKLPDDHLLVKTLIQRSQAPGTECAWIPGIPNN